MAGLNFLDLKSLPVKEAEAVVLPIPYEATTTYGSGAREGPEAILAASRQVELWDEDENWDPQPAIRLATAAPILPEVSGPQAMLEKIKRVVQPWVAQGKLICRPGGRTYHHRGPGPGDADPLPGPDGGGPGRPRRPPGELRRQQTLPRLRHAPGL